MAIHKNSQSSGFTLIELLVVLAIIGILSSIVFFSINESRQKGRDAALKSQVLELLKGLELYYSDSGFYPDDGTIADNTTGATITGIGSGFIGSRYFQRLPDQTARYQYCVSADRKSMMLALDTERDGSGTPSNYCRITRGPGTTASGFGCTAWMAANAADSCINRF